VEEGLDIDVDTDDNPPKFDPSNDEEYNELVDGDLDVMDENI
jgi:hypothetical protein